MIERTRILKRHNEVINHLKSVQFGADSERNALGFLPPNAYKQAAQQEKLFVAVDDTDQYLGHLMFGGVYPHSKVMQAFCIPSSRKQGVAKLLLDELIRQCTNKNYLSISAKVASDLKAANEFYNKNGFKLVAVIQGGATLDRIINRRVLELETPNLFDLMQPENEQDVLGMSQKHLEKQPTYAIDLNVMFDVGKKRIRQPEASAVFKAALSKDIHAVVTQEFIDELSRNASEQDSDPYIQIAKSMDVLPTPKKQEIDELIGKLGELIFPDRYKKNMLTLQDQSDLMHLATAIHNRITGFVTSEKAILQTRSFLEDNYGLDVISVYDFSDALYSNEDQDSLLLAANIDGLELSHEHNISSLNDVKSFLKSLLISERQIGKITSSADHMSKPENALYRQAGEIVLYAFWTVTQTPKRVADVSIFVDENLQTSVTATDHVISHICRRVSADHPCKIVIHITPGHAKTRKAALQHGFRQASGDRANSFELHKTCLNAVLNKKNWDESRTHLKQISGFSLPKNMPDFQSFDQRMNVENSAGKPVQISLNELETLLSPCIILLPQRGGTIVPIKKQYADDLFFTGDQFLLFGQKEASLLRDRVYFNSPKARSVMTVGCLVLFYQSGHKDGGKFIRAMGRITESKLLTADELKSDTIRKGVLDERSLKLIGNKKEKLASTLDNIIIFPRCVPLAKLREIGCADGANFVTAKGVSYKHMMKIINEGFGRD